MKTTIRGILTGFCASILAISLMAQGKMPETKKEAIAGASTVKTEVLSGTVVMVEGNTLVVRMSTGDIRKFDPPADRKFIIDGKEVTVRDLQPGTKLHATLSTTTTPVTDRTTTVGTGKVWFVSGNTVILTLPNNENRMYKVAESYRFIVDGQKATVHDLRKGMTVSAEKIVEVPRTEIASNTTVTGSAPPPPKATPAPAPTEVAERPAPRAAPAPHKAAAAPASAAASAPVETAAAHEPAPAKLPKTAGPFPLVGLLGLLCTGASLGLSTLRRS